MSEKINKWEMELSVFGQLNSAIVLTGDIYDIFPVYSGGRIAQLLTMEQYLCQYFKHHYYQNIVGYDMVKGFYDLGDNRDGSGSGLGELINLIKKDQDSTQAPGQRQAGLLYTIHQFGNQRCLGSGFSGRCRPYDPASDELQHQAYGIDPSVCISDGCPPG